MDHEAAGTDAVRGVDIQVLLPKDGVIRIESARLFAEPDDRLCRRFVERAFLAPEIESVVIAPTPIPTIELRFDPTQRGQRQVLQNLATLLVASDGPSKAATGSG